MLGVLSYTELFFFYSVLTKFVFYFRIILTYVV